MLRVCEKFLCVSMDSKEVMFFKYFENYVFGLLLGEMWVFEILLKVIFFLYMVLLNYTYILYIS